jgi:2'-5' RNA ligase
MDSMRTFIAVDIPTHILKSIQFQVENLRKAVGNSSVRWVPVHNIHLTLKFLGDVPTASVDVLTQTLRDEADLHSVFDVNISGLGSFLNSKRARVLLIGIQAQAELETLQRGIESAYERVGYKPESRAFSPHLTLGRVRQGITEADQIKIRQVLDDVKIDSLGTARVDSVHLYKSELKPSGAVYTKIFTAPLQK